MLRHIIETALAAAMIGAASLAAMLFMIDGSPMMAAGLLASPWLN